MTMSLVIAVVFISMLLICWRRSFIVNRLQKRTQQEHVPSIKELIVQLKRLNGQKSLYGVWLDLVEQHWDNIRDSQGNSDCTFRYKRKIHDAFDKDYVDKEVRSLALNYWQRNRFRLREAFINWCWFMSRNAAKYQILKAASANDAIPCFDDPVVKGRRSNFDADVEWIDIHMPSYFQQRKSEWLREHNLI